MSFPYYEQVQRAYNELLAEGKIKELPPGHTEEVEAQKGLLTMRAGYYSNQIDSSIGILEKTFGNNYKGYSVDILIRRNGDFWDVATDNGRIALPVNGGTNHDNDLIPRWRQPTKELAEVNGNGEPPPPNGDDDEVLAKLEEIQNQLNTVMEVLGHQAGVLDQHTIMLQTIIDKPFTAFPIVYPTYSFRDLFGRVQTMQPQPPMNP